MPLPEEADCGSVGEDDPEKKAKGGGYFVVVSADGCVVTMFRKTEI